MRRYLASDVGTRLEHLVDLHDTLSSSYAILTRPDLYHTPYEEIRAAQLEMALQVLNLYMMAEYDDVSYARVVNELPKPRDIKDVT